MLYPEPMTKLFAIAPKSVLPKVVNTLHAMKVAHFVEHRRDEYDLCQPLLQFDKISSLLVQARSLMSAINIPPVSRPKAMLTISEAESQLEIIKDHVTSVMHAKKKNSDESILVEQQKAIVELMYLAGVSPDDFFISQAIASYFGYVNQKVTAKIHDITDRSLIKSVSKEDRYVIAVFVDSAHKDKIEEILNAAQFQAVDTIATIALRGHAEVLVHSLIQKYIELQKEKEKAETKLVNVTKKYAQQLADIEAFFAAEAEKGQAPLSFGSTKETFFLTGYIPKKRKDEVFERLEKSANNKIHIVEQELGEDEEIPIELDNGAYAKNFEFFTRLYSLPSYHEFDPTKLMAYTFPLFFGFMLGDVVYGIITFLVFYYLRKKIPEGKDLFNILLAASLSAIFFGFLFGEFFGFEPYHGLIIRTHDFNTLMLISIAAGVVQINLGLLIGFYLESRHHGMFHAVCHKLSWIFIQIGGALFFGQLLNMLSVPQYLFYLGGGIFGLGAFLLFKAEGFIGIMEIPSILSHTVSYARLMAVGLASVFLAVLINESATRMIHENIFLIPVAIILLIVGHAFNIALGVLSPSLHAVRLHYVEFFTKFYQGGGIEYTPFGREKQKSIL